MTINLQMPDIRELKPHIAVFGVGGAGGNAVNNMITSGLSGCDFVVANTDAQALASSKAKRVIQLGIESTQGLGAGSHPEVGKAAAEEAIDELRDHLSGAHMAFITAGMGGGTGTGAAPVIARVSKEMGLLTVGVVTKPFQFEGQRRMRLAEAGIEELSKYVDTLIVIPNQNLFRVANEKTTFADAFAMADQVLYSGVACITDLMVKEGLINLDFADVRAVMREMGKAMMGTGEASGERRAVTAAEAAISNPLLDEVSMRGARGLLISITGGKDLTLYEVDEAATRIREEVDPDANIILGATFDQSLEGLVRVSVVATGIEPIPTPTALSNAAERNFAARMRAIEAGERDPIRPMTRETIPHITTDEPVDDEQGATLQPEAVIDEVTFRPMAPRPSLFQPIQQEEARAEEPADEPLKPFIPPQAERPERPVRSPRMPRIDEFPMPAQNEMRAHRGEAPENAALETKRMTLLQRLANIGMGVKAQPEEKAPAEKSNELPSFLKSRDTSSQEKSAVKSNDRRPTEEVSEYFKRPASTRAPVADASTRPAPTRSEEDELEIPAFLRRQAN
ncbi:MAG TPA: cell division protein FtsZ [Xanthobacteraceae bacterium]|nr:cell division protein FtsZ [Xanthobacteraceae bacterium]